MDAKEWGLAVFGGLTTLLAGIIGVQKINRQQSADSLADAENTVGIGYVEALKGERDAAHARAEGIWKLYLEARDEIAAMKLRGVMRDEKISKLESQVRKLTEIVRGDHPEWAALLSEYGGLDE